MFKRILMFITVFVLGFILVACQNGEVNDETKLITSIRHISGVISVDYLDNSTRVLGKAEKDIVAGEVGISKIELNDNGSFVVTFTDDVVENIGFIVGTIGDPIEIEISGMFVRWRFKGSNSSYQNLISLGLLSSQDLKNGLDVRFNIENNELKWKDINDSEWRKLSAYLNIAMITGVTNLEIINITINDLDQAVITFSNNQTVIIDIPLVYHTVVFKDSDGTILKQQKVGIGYGASAPDVDSVLGYELSWDKEFNNVNNDLEVKLVYTPNSYQLNFNFEGIASKNVLFGSEVGLLPIPVIPDVDFLRWEDSLGNTVSNDTIYEWTENITLTPIFSKSPYIINIYTKNNDDDYELFNSELNFGFVGDTVVFNETIEGHVLNNDLSTLSGEINIDGSLELNIYFDNNVYELIFNDYQDLNQEILYGLPISMLPSVELENYRFVGWYTDNTLEDLFDPNIPYTKLGSQVLYPKFELGAFYKFRYHYNGTLITIDEDWADEGTIVTAEFEIPYGYKMDPNTFSTITAAVLHDRTNIFNIYFVSDDFTVSWFNHEGNLISEAPAPYESFLLGTATPPNRSAEGFTFDGWMINGVKYAFSDFSGRKVQVLSNLEIYASYRESEVTYAIVTKFVDGENVISQSFIELTAAAFATVSTTAPQVSGYTLDLDRSNLEVTLTALDYQKSLNIYYQINKRNVYFTVDGNYVEIFNGNVGSPVVFPSAPEKENQTFIGWLYNGRIVSELTVPLIDVGLTALFEDMEAIYYVDYYHERSDGTFKYLAGVSLTGLVGSEVDFIHLYDLLEPPINLDAFYTFDEDNLNNILSGLVIENEFVPNVGTVGLTLKVYYKIKDHTVTYRLGNGQWGEDLIYTFKHGSIIDLGDDVDLSSLEFENYNLTFEGWFLNEGDDPQLIIANFEVLEDTIVYSYIEDISWTVTLMDGFTIVDQFKVFHNDINQLPKLADIDLINFYGPYHKFLGWMDEENNDLSYYFLFNHYRDVTLYAKWQSTGSLFTFDYRDAKPGSNLATITSYNGRNMIESIPRLLGGHVVGYIESGVFTNNPYVQTISMHVSAKEESFNNMPRLREVNIYQYNAFSNLYIPIHFGYRAFADNPVLETVNMGSTGVISMDSHVFADNPSLREVTLPVSMRIIPDYLFLNAISLESVKLTAALQIDNHPHFPQSGYRIVFAATEIGVGAFQNTPNLKTVFEYSFMPFSDTYNPLPRVTGNGANLLTQLTVINNNAFKDSGLESFSLPNSLIRIGSNAFENTKLTAIEFGPNLQRIGNSAFKNTKLVNLVIPENVIQIDGEAFNNIATLETITILGDNYLALPSNSTLFGGTNNISLQWALLGQRVNTNREFAPIFTHSEIFKIYTYNQIRNSGFQIGYTVYTNGEFRVDIYGRPSPMPNR